MLHSDNQKEVTIRDLAVMLALSTATVSRALNDDSSVKKQTKKRVFELAEKFGYRSNDHAKNLRNGYSQTVGCIVPGLDNHFISTIIAGMEKAARRDDYSLVVMQSHGLADTEAFCANFLFNKRVDGLIVAVSKEMDGLANFGPFIQKNIPVVLLGHAGEDPRFVNVTVDHRRAGYDMTRHLLAQGRRRIVHITPHLPQPSHTRRCEGYLQALAEAGIAAKGQYIIKGGLSREDGMDVAEEIGRLKQRPDAIFAANDHSAVGCMMRLRTKGIRIPKDIVIAGFGNDPVASVTDPGLTTMSYPGHQIGEAAVTQLVHRLYGPAASKMVGAILLRSSLVVRGSTLND
jgi:LacI family transcriptional regulator